MQSIFNQLGVGTIKPLYEKHTTDPKKHYCYMEVKDRGEWENDLDQRLDLDSPTKPGTLMFTIEIDGTKPEGRKKLGSGRHVLLSCSIEDYNLWMKAVTDRAKMLSEPDKAEGYSVTTVDEPIHLTVDPGQ